MPDHVGRSSWYDQAVSSTAGKHRFGLKVLGRYQTEHEGGEMAVTVNLVAGRDDHLVHAGTLTMSESEWATFTAALKDSLGDNVEIDDGGPPH